jgi:hypothetical protein
MDENHIVYLILNHVSHVIIHFEINNYTKHHYLFICVRLVIVILFYKSNISYPRMNLFHLLL